MKDIKHIVAPVDLEQHTDKLMDFAVEMANSLESDITFFHGVEFEYGSMGEVVFGEFSSKDLNAYRLEKAREALEAKTAGYKEKCKGECRSMVAFGYVVDLIVNYAADRGGDMIIIGTHGRRGIEKILLGSVAEGVIKRSPCPTLVINPSRH